MKKLLNVLSFIAIGAIMVSVNGCGDGSADDNNTYSVGGGIYRLGNSGADIDTPNYMKIKPTGYVKCNLKSQELSDSAQYVIVLNLNGTQNLNVSWSEGEYSEAYGVSSTKITDFTFANKLNNGEDYNVTVVSCNGAGLNSCTPNQNTATGEINNSNVTNVIIGCNYDIWFITI